MADRLTLLASPSVASAFGSGLGRTVEYHPRLASTQDRALALADAGSGRAIVVTDEQTEGRGTRGRVWLAPAGTALLASWLFRPAPAEPALTTLLAGVAVVRSLDALGVRGAALDWPNDVLVAGRKVAGVLANGVSAGAEQTLVLGIGVNVLQEERDFPPELRLSATSLRLAGPVVDRLELLERLTRELDRIAAPSGIADGLAEWRARAPLLGRTVVVTRDGAAPVRGVATDLDADGALVVQTPYGPQRIVAGEVRVE